MKKLLLLLTLVTMMLVVPSFTTVNAQFGSDTGDVPATPFDEDDYCYELVEGHWEWRMYAVFLIPYYVDAYIEEVIC